MVLLVSKSADMLQRHYPLYHRSAFRPTRMGSIINHPRYSSNYYNAPSSYFYSYAPGVSTTSSADEVEAATVLISLPLSNASPRSQCPVYVSSHEPIETSPMTISKIKPIPTIRQPTSLPSHEVSSTHLDSNKTIVSPISTTDASSVSSNHSTTISSEWFTGTVSLSLPEDDDVLSPLHCYIRRYCVEAFSATPLDVATPRYGQAHGGKVVEKQVGIRCVHCKHLPLDRRPDRAVCFPSSRRNIYHSIETWQRRHLAICTSIPAWIKRDLTRIIQSSRLTAGGRRNYWEDAATRLGLVDSQQGVRFARPPGMMDSSLPISELTRPVPEASFLVTPKERDMVTDYLFLLMEQMETCRFTEDDRIGGRSKVKGYPVGFQGMQCKHCRGQAGCGRYFPISVDALALANSDRNMFNHLLKCRKCPESIKQELQLQKQRAGSRNKRGERKHFFAKVWQRIHAEE